MAKKDSDKLPVKTGIRAIHAPRIPLPAGNIQVNFCKQPNCANFNNPASSKSPPRGKPAKLIRPDDYTVSGPASAPFIKCGKCRECPPLKSNVGIKEELDRISSYLEPVTTLVSCPMSECTNHGVDVLTHRSRYWSFGKTKAGSQRYRCKSCGATFSAGQKPTSRQRLTHVNGRIFKALVHKQPLKCIADEKGVSMKTLYDKIDFIHKQCMAFAGSRERHLPDLKRKHMNISVDRQVYSVNWASKEDRRNVQVYAVGSADSRSGYVFGMHLNYDPSQDPEKIEADAWAIGDYLVKRPFRKYARFWLAGDYADAMKHPPDIPIVNTKDPAWAKSAARYYEAMQRHDIEAPDVQTVFSMLPLRGMQVHAEYTLYAHFFLLKKQLAGVENISFHLDQDSGMRAACLGAFADRILNKSCNAFYVTIKTDYTQEEKYSMVKKGEREKKEFLHAHPEYSELRDIFIRREIIEERLGNMIEIGKWSDEWLEYPFPEMSEPDKVVCYLTNIKQGLYDTNLHKLAIMFERATLHPIDRFFMQVRSASSILERSHRTTNRGSRIWQKYNAYDPGIIAKLLDIYRVYYNYVKLTPGKMGKKPKDQPKRKRGELQKLMKTPAMRLGLAKGPVSIDTILNFTGAENGKDNSGNNE